MNQNPPGTPSVQPAAQVDDDWFDVRFPPIPLISGHTVTSDGVRKEIKKVSVVMEDENGTEHKVPLTPQYGGWWPPREL